MTLDEAVVPASTLHGAGRRTSHGQPAVKANGHRMSDVRRESDTSFVCSLDIGPNQILIETIPETFRDTPRDGGYPAVLVRYAAPDDAPVRGAIERAHALTPAKRPPRPPTNG